LFHYNEPLIEVTRYNEANFAKEYHRRHWELQGLRWAISISDMEAVKSTSDINHRKTDNYPSIYK
jgi:hypothetical protein